MPNTKRIVMVVDDEDDLVQSITAVLDPHYIVLTANSGSAAWSILRSGMRPDVLLTDLHVGKLNGYRLIANIRNSSHLTALPIVLMSGDTLLPDIAASLGIPHVLTKPCDAAALLNLVRSILAP